MSHITKIKTQISDQGFLLQALEDLGYQYILGDQEIQSSSGKKTRVDVKIPLRFSADIGFVRSGDHFQLVADWFGVIGLSKEKFLNALHQRYAYRVTISKLEQKGFHLVEEKQEEKNQIRLILRRMS